MSLNSIFGISEGEKPPVFVVAEVSGNHRKEFGLAAEMIKTAKKCGADAIKFQAYTPDTLTINADNKYFRIKHPEWGGQTLYELYQKAYTPWEWFKQLKKIADDIGITFLCTAFDKTSVDLLEGLDICAHKISSFELVDLALVEYAAKTKKPLILSTDGTLLRGLYTAPDLSEVPSPYLEGFLDPFLLDGYEPIIESMRGCPYSCKFCVSGTPLWSKLRAFELDRVFAEFEYVKKKATNRSLILFDENFGILQDRDVKVAEYIIKSFKDSGFPPMLYFYSAKIITEQVLKVIETLAPIGRFGMSFQTLDDAVRKEMGRTNVKYDDFLRHIQWSKERRIVTSTEMIFGFPGETADNYIKGLEKLLRSGVDRINSYNLRLLSGIDLSTEESRAKYRFKTMYRLPERTFGYYDGTVITEIEEVVVGCHSFNYDDYQKVRKYGLFLELASGRRYLSELMQLMMNFGLASEKLVTFLTEHEFGGYPRLHSIVSEYTRRANEELFESPQACTEYVRKLISEGTPVPEVKLNYIYTGKIMLDSKARDELFEVVKDFVRIHSSSEKEVVFFSDYIDNILAKRIVSFSSDEEAVVHSQSMIRLERLERNDYDCIDDLLADDKSLLEFELHKDALDFIQKKIPCSTDEEAIMQDIYMTITKFGLLRLRRAKSEECIV